MCIIGTCKGDYKLAQDEKTCILQCEKWVLTVYAEARCVDECPDDLKPVDSSVTEGTCLTCAEATKTEENPDGERPFFNKMTQTCVAACPAGTYQLNSDE